ncbi:MAG: methyl-accepting chemotaxis protein [Desulfobacteraceae bacterium]|nr:MAG: methyl-accepting chemotaxis protein [Desulfobacteraceae bacterium]
MALRIQDLSLNIKVFCISLIAVLIVIGIAGTGTYFYARIEDNNRLKNQIGTIEKNVIEAMVAEKIWLQFFSPESKKSFDEKVGRIESDIKSLKTGNDSSGYRDFIEKADELLARYKNECDGIEKNHEVHQSLKQEMVKPLHFADGLLASILKKMIDRQSGLQMEGEDLTAVEMEFTNIVRECRIVFLQMQNIQQQFISTGDKKFIDDFNRLASGDVKVTVDNVVAFADTLEDKSYIDTASKVGTAINEFKGYVEKSLALTAEQTSTVQRLSATGTQIVTIFRGFLDQLNQSIDDEKQMAVTAVISIVILGMIVLFSGTFFLLRNMVLKPIGSVMGFAEKLRLGDLSARLDMNRMDEIGRMGAALDEVVADLNIKAGIADAISEGDLMQDVQSASRQDVLGNALAKMLGNLNDIVGNILFSVSQVNASAGQVSDSSQSLSQGATEQASSLEEITSSMTEISNQAKTNAENARQANNLAASTQSSSQKGVDKMKMLMSAMEGISKSSREIGKIIKTIDDIAFQTNLLALNAAVEAARAGKHGKGFAVVAQEVRTLASRSAKAAQETSDLIEGSGKKVAEGSNIAEETSKALSEISESITTVVDLVSEIAAASNEQAQGVSQVNQGLSQIDGVTQQNAANAEQASSAAAILSSQAAEVRELLSQFKLKNQNIRSETDNNNPVPDVPRIPYVRPEPPATAQGAWGKPEA